jgi:hypothetical protein
MSDNPKNSSVFDTIVSTMKNLITDENGPLRKLQEMDPSVRRGLAHTVGDKVYDLIPNTYRPMAAQMSAGVNSYLAISGHGDAKEDPTTWKAAWFDVAGSFAAGVLMRSAMDAGRPTTREPDPTDFVVGRPPSRHADEPLSPTEMMSIASHLGLTERATIDFVTSYLAYFKKHGTNEGFVYEVSPTTAFDFSLWQSERRVADLKERLRNTDARFEDVEDEAEGLKSRVEAVSNVQDTIQNAVEFINSILARNGDEDLAGGESKPPKEA